MEDHVKQAVDAGLARIPTLDISDTGLGPWSYSTLKTLEKCPLKFFLDKIAKVKLPRTVDDDSANTFAGTAAHYWLELVMGGIAVPVAYLDTKAKYYEELGEKYWPLVEEVTPQIYAFADRMKQFSDSNRITHVQPELKVGLDKNFNKVSFFDKEVYFRGIMDLPIRLANGDAIILDHKYGPDPTWGLKHFVKQLRVYKVLTHLGVAKLRGAQAGINFIRGGEVLLDNYSSATEIENKFLPDLQMDIKDAVRRVSNEQKFDYDRGSQCTYCDYKAMCSGGKRGTAGELQYIVDETHRLMKGVPTV